MQWFLVFISLIGARRARGSNDFELPETLEDLAQQIDFFENPLFRQIPGCKNISTPFLLRYDTLGNGLKVPVCLSESEILRRRLDPDVCSTKVTLGEKVDGGCSQYNFFKDVRSTSYLNNFVDLTADDVVAVPMHRNVPYYHGNVDGSPAFETEEYYLETKYLPCDLKSDLADLESRANSLKGRDLDVGAATQGYCDVDAIVKQKLCWSGSGADASVTDRELVNGSYFNEPQPCDVMQHAEPRATAWRNKRLSIHTPHRYDNRAKTVTSQNREDAEAEAAQQKCVQDGVKRLHELEDAEWYSGMDKENPPSEDFWNTAKWRPDVCRAKRSFRCMDKSGNTCASDSDGCDVYNVYTYSISGVNNCLRKTIERSWTGTILGEDRRVASRTYTRAPTNWEKYFSATSRTTPNACSAEDTQEQCAEQCYDACKAMKFPGFSVSVQGNHRCVCSDYASKSLCPKGQWRESYSRKSYTISPMCESEACNRKTVYEKNLKPCQFTPVYRKQKCLETCSAENSLFMTISQSGLCMCSKAKRRLDNTPVQFVSGDVCPWSTSARVYKDSIDRLGGKGFLGDSYVTNTAIETYQLVYSSYFGENADLDDGVVVCERGSPTQEIYRWFASVTGSSFYDAFTIQELKNAYKELP